MLVTSSIRPTALFASLGPALVFSDTIPLADDALWDTQGTDNDTLEIEIWQSWLLPSNEAEFKHQQANR